MEINIRTMSTMESLKSKELRVAGYIDKFLAFAKYIEGKALAFQRNSTEQLRDDLAKQRSIRADYLITLALEAQRVNDEIDEITEAHGRHSENLEMYKG